MAVLAPARPHEVPVLPRPGEPPAPVHSANVGANPGQPPARPTCPGCSSPHPRHLTGGGEAELVAALRAGCPEAAALLVEAVTARVLAARPSRRAPEGHDGAPRPAGRASKTGAATATADLAGRCWLLLAQWPATRQDIVAQVSARLLRELDEDASRARRIVALPTHGARLDGPEEPDPDPAPAAALVDRAVSLGLVSTAQARLLTRIHVDGLTSEQVGALKGRSPEAVRACCHRALRRLRASRSLLVDDQAAAPVALIGRRGDIWSRMAA